MTNSLRKVQERARRSSIVEETEVDQKIKDLFTQRIVKGRPDLFVTSTPVPGPSSQTPTPSTPTLSTETVQRLEVLQSNITGFVFIFLLSHSSSSASLPSSKPSRPLLEIMKTGLSEEMTLTSVLDVMTLSRMILLKTLFMKAHSLS